MTPWVVVGGWQVGVTIDRVITSPDTPQAGAGGGGSRGAPRQSLLISISTRLAMALTD